MNTPGIQGSATTSGAEPPETTLTFALVGCTLVAALGGLLFGFDTAVISGTTSTLKDVFKIDGFQLGFTVASALIGTIIGSIFSGRPADLWGRRPVLMVLAVFYFLSALGTAMAANWWMLIAFRFLGGIAVGGASVVSPLYIAEISPARYRGRLVAIMQFNIVLGILLAFLSNYLIAQMKLGASEWRWMLGVQAIPSALFFLLLLPTMESPRWLVGRGKNDEAKTVLEKLGNDEAGAQWEVEEIQRAIAGEREEGSGSLFQKAYRVPVMLAIAIAMFNQLSGINAVLYYAPDIFKLAGAGADAALLQAVAIGATNLVFTLLAMFIIDLHGRRRLMLIGSVGYIISLIAIAWAFYTYGQNFTSTGKVVVLVSLMLFIASHAFGQGAVIWVFISEIFPNRVRARGQALGSSTHWIMAAIVTWTFPWIAEWSGGHVFAFYAAMMVLQLFWVLFIMPETKGVPLEEMQKTLGVE